MRNLIIGLGVILFVAGCQNETDKTDSTEDPKPEKELGDGKVLNKDIEDISEEGMIAYFTQFLHRQADMELEPSDFRFYRGHMNRDTILDWVVTVNAFKYAKKSLEKQQNLMPIDYGYLGNYNHLFVVNGETGAWNGRPVASSSVNHLDVQIDYVNSDQYQVPVVYFRVGTSKFVTVFNSSVPQFQEIFNWEVFNLSDNKNNGNPTARIIEFQGPENGAKEIVVYDGEVVNFDQNAFADSIASYEPEIKKASLKELLRLEYKLAQGKFGEIRK